MMSTNRICSSLSIIGCDALLGSGLGLGSYAYGFWDDKNSNALELLFFILAGMSLGTLHGIRRACKQEQERPPTPPPSVLIVPSDQNIQIHTEHLSEPLLNDGQERQRNSVAIS